MELTQKTSAVNVTPLNWVIAGLTILLAFHPLKSALSAKERVTMTETCTVWNMSPLVALTVIM